MQNVLPLRFRRELVALPRAASPEVAWSGAASEDLTAPQVTTVDEIELGPLASIAVRCALVVTAIGALGVVALWLLASSSGVVGRSESFMQSIGFRDFQISPAAVIVGAVLVMAGIALTAASFVVVAGAAYNLLARHGRGLRLRIATPVASDASDPGVVRVATGEPAA